MLKRGRNQDYFGTKKFFVEFELFCGFNYEFLPSHKGRLTVFPSGTSLFQFWNFLKKFCDIFLLLKCCKNEIILWRIMKYC